MVEINYEYPMNMNEVREQFDSQGFVGPFDLLSPEEAKAISAEAWDTTATQKWAMQFRAHEQIPTLRRLVLSPVILNIASALLGPEVIFWGGRYLANVGRPRAKSSPTPWHQELDFARVLGCGTAAIGVQLYLALDEANRDNGTMQVLPGSHRDPALDVNSIYDESVLLNAETNGHLYSRKVVADLLEANSYEAVDLNAKPGQFYFFDWRTAHQTGDAATTDKRRLTVNARFTTPRSTFNSPMYTDRFPKPLKCVEAGRVLPRH